MTAAEESLTFHNDLAQLTARISASTKGVKLFYPPKLGDVIQQMGREKLLLCRLKDDDFAIKESNELSDVSRDYLNALQLEKFYSCRLCYTKNDADRCEFHKKYVHTSLISNKTNEDYVNFLNSEMGIISFVELYYTFLSVPQWKMTAVFLFRDLTGHSSIRELLNAYNHKCSLDVDHIDYETMEMDEQDEYLI